MIAILHWTISSRPLLSLARVSSALRRAKAFQTIRLVPVGLLSGFTRWWCYPPGRDLLATCIGTQELAPKLAPNAVVLGAMACYRLVGRCPKTRRNLDETRLAAMAWDG
jgi:hypothetical protein